MRRLSLLAGVATAVAVGALVLGGSVAGVVAGRALVTVVAFVAAGFAGLGLGIGWRPALAVGLGLGLVAGIVLPSDTVPWAAAAVLGAAVAVSHEAGRLSIDLRRPSRLGPRVLGHLLGAGAAAAAVAPAAALVGAVLPERNLPGLLVPVALVLAAVPVAAPALVGSGGAAAPRHGLHRDAGGRPPRLVSAASRATASLGTVTRLVVAGLVATAVVVAALLGAAARDELPTTTTPSATASRTATTDPLPEAPTGADPGTAPGVAEPPARGSIVGIAVLTLVAGVIILLLSGLRRNRIPLVQDLVDVGPDEPGLNIVGASEAELDDEDVVLADDVAAALVADITVDLRSEPDPGRAVRYAYARVEQRLASLGIERRPAESEPELLRRALGVLGDEGRALADLTALFERARFSDEPVPEALRTGALTALEQLRARLEPAR